MKKHTIYHWCVKHKCLGVGSPETVLDIFIDCEFANS